MTVVLINIDPFCAAAVPGEGAKFFVLRSMLPDALRVHSALPRASAEHQREATRGFAAVVVALLSLSKSQKMDEGEQIFFEDSDNL